jgi:anti-sigma regulatory factor (Ser/Thr protein kinase)
VISDFRFQRPITSDLAVLRERVSSFGTGAGLSGQCLLDLVIAANEAATNVLQHGGGSGILTAWCDEVGVSLEFVDAAGTLTDAHLDTGPEPAVGQGSGLWLIRRLCDEVSLERVAGMARLHLCLHHRARAAA